MYFLGAPWALDWPRDEPALSLQMLLPLALQKKLCTAILLVRAWDLLKLAQHNVLLFKLNRSGCFMQIKRTVTENEVDEYELTCYGLNGSAKAGQQLNC